MQTERRRYAPPRADALVESLRGLGYSTATALADIVDNSIAAEAGRVEIHFSEAGPDAFVRITDDGRGMDDPALESAMRLGDRNPLESRTTADLGRFGLGLKTASFSQARRLTVASRNGSGNGGCLRWDLDALAAGGDGDGWNLLEGPADGSADRLLFPDRSASGTIVLWEKTDRIVTDGFGDHDMLNLIDVVEQHLAMTFHRYLEGTKPRLDLRINRRKVMPWDPFLTGNPAKPWVSPVARPGPRVEVQCHVLPHRDRLDARSQEASAGPQGWTSQQGFYVYRNERLLVAGSWLGLGRGRGWTKDEAHRLARIRLDIPNDADADWKIDVRKSTAHPPVQLRAQLTRLAEETRDRARRVFAHRGRVAVKAGPGAVIEQVWQAVPGPGGVRYRIDRSHDAVRAVLEAAGALSAEVDAVLRLIEETVPVQRIWLDTAEGRDTPRTGFGGQATSEVSAVLAVMYRSLVGRRGLSPEAARERLGRTEPFNDYPALVAALPDDVETISQ